MCVRAWRTAIQHSTHNNKRVMMMMLMVDAQKHSFGRTHKHMYPYEENMCWSEKKNMDVSQHEPCKSALYKRIECKADAKCFKDFRIVQLWCCFFSTTFHSLNWVLFLVNLDRRYRFSCRFWYTQFYFASSDWHTCEFNISNTQNYPCNKTQMYENWTIFLHTNNEHKKLIVGWINLRSVVISADHSRK